MTDDKRREEAEELRRTASILKDQREVFLEMAEDLQGIAEERASDLYGLAEQWSKTIGLKLGSASGISHDLPERPEGE